MNVLIRIPDALKKVLELIAKEEHRSLNNLINVILEDYVKARYWEIHEKYWGEEALSKIPKDTLTLRDNDGKVFTFKGDDK